MNFGSVFVCEDIMQHIFEFLTPSELLTSRLVCKSWKEIVGRVNSSHDIMCLTIDEQKVRKVFPNNKLCLVSCRKRKLVEETDGEIGVEFSHHHSSDMLLVTGNKIPAYTKYIRDREDGELQMIQETYYRTQTEISKIVYISYDFSNIDDPVRTYVLEFP